MLERFRPWARHLVEHPARLLARAGVSPNTLTIIGLCLNALVALVLSLGHPVLGGALVLVANAFDMLDGAVARVSGKGTRFGAFLDSTVDRYAEALLYLGVLAWLFSVGDAASLLAGYLAIVGSLMVSYARARAEGLGVEGEVGWLPRPERILLLAIGLLFYQYLLTPVLWLLALLTNVTVTQRMLYVRERLGTSERRPPT